MVYVLLGLEANLMHNFRDAGSQLMRMDTPSPFALRYRRAGAPKASIRRQAYPVLSLSKGQPERV